MSNENDIKLKVTTQYDGDGLTQAQDAMDGMKSDVSALDDLLNNAADFEEAFRASDVDKARKALDRMRKSMQRLAKETGNETSPEMRELNAQFKEAETRLNELGDEAKRTGDSLEELNVKADGGAESLKKIEALQVAAALQGSIESARGAGRAFALMGDESKGMGEKTLEAATGLGAFAAAAQAAKVALGPWGIALVAVTAAIQLAVDLMGDHKDIVLENAEKEVEALGKVRDAAKKNREEAKKGVESAKNYKKYIDSLKDAADAEKAAIDAQSNSLKKQMDLREKITQIGLTAAKTVIESKLATGETSKEDGAKQLAKIEALQRQSAAKNEEDKIALDIATIESQLAAKEQDILDIKKQRRDIAVEHYKSAEESWNQADEKSEESESLLKAALSKLKGVKGVDFDDNGFGGDPLKKLGELEAALNKDRKDSWSALDVGGGVADFKAGREVIDEARTIIIAALEARGKAEQLKKSASKSERRGDQAGASFEGRETAAEKGIKADQKALISRREDLNVYQQGAEVEELGQQLTDVKNTQQSTLESSAGKFSNLIEDIRKGTDEIHETSAKNAEEFQEIKAENDAALETLSKVTEDGWSNAEEYRKFADAQATIKKNTNGTNRKLFSHLSEMNDLNRVMVSKLSQFSREQANHRAAIEALQ